MAVLFFSQFSFLLMLHIFDNRFNYFLSGERSFLSWWK
jgi:hypothetical protein